MKKYKNLENPIIFIGTGRTGSTIISEIIDRHPDLAFPNIYQDKYPARSKVNLIRSVFDNSLWRIFGHKPQLNKTSPLNKYIFKPSESYQMWNYLVGEGLNFSRSFLLEDRLSEERIDFIRSYFDKMVTYQNRNRLTFKITGPSRLSFLLQIFPDALFIDLKRNLIPTISSFVKVDFWESRGAHQLWWFGAYTAKEEEWARNNSENAALLTAFQLKRICQTTETEVQKFQPKYLEVHYEDFVANPEKELKRILTFTELPSFDIAAHLAANEIHSRNKKDTDYFDQDELERLYQIIK